MTTTHEHDFIVIGGGNAGLAAARVAREAGRSVLVVEARELGGTCPLRGCVPKKVLVAAAEVLDAIARAPEHGIAVTGARLDWPKLIERKQSFVRGVPEEFRASLEKRGVKLAQGRARFVGDHEIQIGSERHRAKKIVVATGSIPRPLPFEGGALAATSDDVLELAELPREIVFIGAGVIAMEFCHVLSRAGAKLTLLEALPRPLGAFDPDLVDGLLAETRRLGVAVECDVKVTKLERHGNRFIVHAGRRIEADLVVNGAGRIADFSSLELERAGVDLDGKKPTPKLDQYLRSVSNPDLAFAGDALPAAPQLSPLATYEGSLAAKNLLAESDRELAVPDYASVPSVVFSVPALARVGMTEAEARDQKLDFEVKQNDLRSWRSARTYAETAAQSKILIEQKTQRILGAHLLGHGAQETIHAFAFHIRHGLPASELAAAVAAYPTFHADLKHML